MLIRLHMSIETEEGLFSGPVEFDELYAGGKRACMSNAKRRELVAKGAVRDAVGKVAVIGVKARSDGPRASGREHRQVDNCRASSSRTPPLIPS